MARRYMLVTPDDKEKSWETSGVFYLYTLDHPNLREENIGHWDREARLQVPWGQQ